MADKYATINIDYALNKVSTILLRVVLMGKSEIPNDANVSALIEEIQKLEQYLELKKKGTTK